MKERIKRAFAVAKNNVKDNKGAYTFALIAMSAIGLARYNATKEPKMVRYYDYDKDLEDLDELTELERQMALEEEVS